MTVRCKFRCNSVTQSDSSRSKKVPDESVKDGWRWESERCVLYSAVFTPVYSEKPDSENKRFWEATPNGKLELTTIKEMPFEVGQDYYLDITPAE